MTYAEFQKTLEEAGLTLREFALLMKLNPNSVTNYKQRGTVPSHLGVIACLVRELALHKIDYHAAIESARVTAKAKRGSATASFGRKQ
jgi:hypothetical protein